MAIRIAELVRAGLIAFTATALLLATLSVAPAPASALDGAVFTWGSNQYGQLGDSTATDRADAVAAGVAASTDLAGGRHHVLSLTPDGRVNAWGWNGSGQLGDGTSVNRPTPVQLSLSNVTAVGAGHYHSLAVIDGQVYAWGRNPDGQLGLGNTINQRNPSLVPDVSGVEAVAGGREHSIAMRTDGTMLAWGNNVDGQLGNGTFTSSNSPISVNITNVEAITAGRIHTAVLRADGTVWTWGNNAYGQLGDGTFTDRSTPQQVAGLPTIVDVEAFGFHTIALGADGSVWAWGRNNLDQLGNGTGQLSATAVQVSIPAAVAIGSGRDYAMAAAADGTIWAWGRNDSGQLGDGTTNDSQGPVSGQVVPGAAEMVGGRDYVAVRTNTDTPPPPPPPDPELACTATAVGNDLRLDWSEGFGRAVIRRDGKWLSTPGDVSTTTISGAANSASEYLVRVRIDGVITDAVCERDGTPPPPPQSPCTATAVAGGVELAWEGSFTSVNLRRNGRWLGRVNNVASAIVDGTTADSFEIVVRPGGVKTTIPCD